MSSMKKCEEDEKKTWLLVISVCALLAFSLSTTGGRQRQVAPAAGSMKPMLLNSRLEPKPEARQLVNYEEFVAAAQTGGGPVLSELAFISQLVSVGRHNLATMSGREFYYVRQALRDETRASGQVGRRSGAAGGRTRAAPEGAVGAPSADLKLHPNLVSRWFSQMLKSEADYEIPSYSLEAQRDPENVTHIDADLRYCTDSIKDQGRCGACYAFSWLSLAEWHYCRQLGQNRTVDFSEQHIVDCGAVVFMSGCEHGKLSDAKDFTQAYGIYLESDYPYRPGGRQAACKSIQGKLAAKVTKFKRIRVERHSFERVLHEQPILLEVFLPADINSYSSGIHPGTNCDPKLGHGMLLVGHGRQQGRPYWLLRNSMGRKWGENGYLRLARDTVDMDKCFKNAFVAKLKFKDLDPSNYEDFYDSLQFEPPEALVNKTALNALKEQQRAVAEDN